MLDYIKEHALKNVWCTPEQDYQYVFKPARITTPRGVRKYTMVEWNRVWLPDQTSIFHVYQIGQLSPKTLKLITEPGVWYKVSDLCNDNNTTIDIYFNNGKQLPRFDVWIRKTETRNLIVAVREQKRIGDLVNNPIFIRFYSNAFFASTRSHSSTDHIFTKGQYATDRASVVVFQRDIRDLRDLGGHVYVFHNGMLVNDTHPDLVVEGDVIELVHDTTIYDTVEFKVSDLEVFTSTLDQTTKYLLSRLKGSTTTIDFHDDIDIWLVKKTGEAYSGVYYHRSKASDVRMVTHKDYSIPVNRVLSFATDISQWNDPLELTVLLHVRKSGYSRPLVNENNRIKELYRLDNEKILDAMVGANSTIEEWKASNLENSNYPKIMRSLSLDITSELVQEAYGYNAISKLVADTPSPVTVLAGANGAKLPFGLRQNSTMFEYDSQGKLLEYHTHPHGEVYYTSNLQASKVEGLTGTGSDSLLTYYDQLIVELTEGKDFACYICPIRGGVPTYEWERILPGIDNEYYSIENNILTWNDQLLSDTHFAVRKDDNFLLYSQDLTLETGILKLELEAFEFYNGVLEKRPLMLPMLHLDIFLNGYSLIENIDYFIKDNQVVITNKEYLKTNTVIQNVVVRAIGLAGTSVYWEKAREYGFVEHNLLSRNTKYDIRDDKVIRYIVGGKLRNKEELKFSEDGIAVRMIDIPNGTPYCLSETVVALRGLNNTTTYDFREQAKVIDEKISNYLGMYYPEEIIEEPSIITERYQILSPFISKIHYDLTSGYFYPDEITGHYSDVKVRELTKPYEYLLDFDPVLKEMDERYVTIHPHHLFVETELDIYQYKFLQRIINVYLDDAIGLSGHVRIKEGWI